MPCCPQAGYFRTSRFKAAKYVPTILLIGYTALFLGACARVTAPTDGVTLEAQAAKLALEVETLPVAQLYGAKTAVSNDGGCSGGRCAFLEAKASGPYVTYRVAAPSAGRYAVQVRVKKWRTRGTFQLAFAEDAPESFSLVGSPTDLYTPAATFATLTLGEVRFTQAGDKYFKFTVGGKNAQSGGYALALDTLTLVPAGDLSPTTGPTTDPTGDGWISLFNGKNLDGWTTFLPSRGRNNDPEGVFKVENGMLHILDVPDRGQRQEFGYLATNRSYGDYHLRFEYRWGAKKFVPRANAKRDSGVMYHLQGSDRVWPRSVELQVQEGDTGDFWLIGGTTLSTTVASIRQNPKRYRGGGTPYTTRPGLFVQIANDQTRDSKSGWNTVELIVKGNEAVHIVNGQVVNRGELQSGGKPLTEGRIAFQAEGAEVYYRNIELKPALSESGGQGGGERITLFDGRSAAEWTPANRGGRPWAVRSGALEVRPGSRVGQNDLETKRSFGDFKLHVEFQVPESRANASEQNRGNSGIYLQGRYEVQVLDSYRQRLSGKNDAGAVYGVRDASRNASRPAGSWQSYDVTFRAPQYSGSRKVKPAYVSVVWNGVQVHSGTAIPGSTTLGDAEGPGDGPIRLQDHGHRVRYRNIWLEPLD